MDQGERDNEDETETEEETSDAAKESAGAAAPKAAAKAPAPAPKVARPAAPPVPASVGSAAGLGKTLGLFVGVVGAIALLIMLIGAEGTGGGTAAPKWKIGDSVDVELTLVSTDKGDLACASGTEVGGRHCQFESANKPWSKGNTTDDKTLKPYATVDRVNLLAAGVWSQPVLEKEMPRSRFSLKCKYSVEGKMPRADVRWREGEGWAGVNEWYTGVVTDCKVASTQ